ncbi:RNA-directed DNA polymerase, eukaryota [Tanacetum coccineum]
MPRSGIESEQWDHLLDSLEGVMLSPSEDRWSWDLNGSGEFSVASARRYIDNNRLPDISSKTRWIKEVPIKVNVHAWKVRINGLPTRWNISRRGIDIPSILCPLCETGVESSKHLFFNCSVVRAIFRRVCIWWDVSYMELDSFDEWISWITNLRLPSKHKRLLEGVQDEKGAYGCMPVTEDSNQTVKPYASKNTGVCLSLKVLSKPYGCMPRSIKPYDTLLNLADLVFVVNPKP